MIFCASYWNANILFDTALAQITMLTKYKHAYKINSSLLDFSGAREMGATSNLENYNIDAKSVTH